MRRAAARTRPLSTTRASSSGASTGKLKRGPESRPGSSQPANANVAARTAAGAATMTSTRPARRRRRLMVPPPPRERRTNRPHGDEQRRARLTVREARGAMICFMGSGKDPKPSVAPARAGGSHPIPRLWEDDAEPTSGTAPTSDLARKTSGFTCKPRASSARRAVLLAMAGSAAGRVVLLESRKVTIGRSRQADFTLQDEGVSRMHCVDRQPGREVRARRPRLDARDAGQRGTYRSRRARSRATASSSGPSRCSSSTSATPPSKACSTSSITAPRATS